MNSLVWRNFAGIDRLVFRNPKRSIPLMLDIGRVSVVEQAQFLARLKAQLRYSFLSATMGSTREARLAGR